MAKLSTPQDFIPLDDIVRLKYTGPFGERARLVREDENDMSDEEDMGKFYSAKKLLQSEEEKRDAKSRRTFWPWNRGAVKRRSMMGLGRRIGGECGDDHHPGVREGEEDGWN
ncbi:hypothetical protein GPALN_007799 [Globodera pallida]|nr:hypothetical protein GPALN_007799 [Globodera pallida]